MLQESINSMKEMKTATVNANSKNEESHRLISAQKREIGELRKQVLAKERAEKRSDEVACSMCNFVEKEDRINICTTCAAKNHNVDVKKGEKVARSGGFNTMMYINDLAICATCVLKDHVGEDHKIVQFYPVLAATETDKYLSTFMGLRQKMGDMKSDLNHSKDELFANLKTIDGKFKDMYDLVKRSKSSVATKID